MLDTFIAADEHKMQLLQNQLFPLFAKSPKNEFALANKPHIMLNLMESFGLQMLEHSNDINLLGELEKHFEEDFIFRRFLSFGNNTGPSLSMLFTYSPKVLLKSQYKKHYLAHTPIELYKAQGYKVIFLTSGNRTWFDVGEFMEIQGVDEIIDEIILSKEYKGVEKSRFAYGIGDEFMYKKALELLENAQQPLLILALTAANHSPYPNVYESISTESIPPNLLKHITRKPYKALNTYIYANNEFGKFLSAFKNSWVKDKTIIAATGDHRMRDFTIDSIKESALAYSVPLYLYVPSSYQHNIVYDAFRVGSHKDIFPTLYALSLSEVEYLNLGGRNMLGTKENDKYEFAYNQALWLDEKGIYPLHSDRGYAYENPQSLLSNGEHFALDEYHLHFPKLYDELNEQQLRFRLINMHQHKQD
ncbi:LTA synthase family protein [Helicobacter sp. MIT 21-1697]|nr:LTA synthase family protein [Helicobacter sp. MIT 21-1697]